MFLHSAAPAYSILPHIYTCLYLNVSACRKKRLGVRYDLPPNRLHMRKLHRETPKAELAVVRSLIALRLISVTMVAPWSFSRKVRRHALIHICRWQQPHQCLTKTCHRHTYTHCDTKGLKICHNMHCTGILITVKGVCSQKVHECILTKPQTFNKHFSVHKIAKSATHSDKHNE